MSPIFAPDAATTSQRFTPVRTARAAGALAVAIGLAVSFGCARAQAPSARVPVPEPALATITIPRLAAPIRFLTNDLLEGRVVGHRGNEIAEIFVASALERTGLAGVNVSSDGPYYQSFELLGAVAEPGNTLVVSGPAVSGAARATYEIGPDFSPINISTLGEVSGNLVVAGYGISDPAHGEDDYQGVEAAGKIVLVLDGSGTLNLLDVTPTVKARVAKAHGATGLIIATPVIDGKRVWPDAISPKVNRFIPPARTDGVEIPVVNISLKLADRLLAPRGQTVDSLTKRLAETRTGASFALPGQRATIAVHLARRRVVVRNLLAVMEGTDPVLKNELVVIGAHFDANGIDDKGLIYRGADDNASGASAVLAVAGAFAQAAADGMRPKRTVVFALWNSEEKARSGSTYYVGHPVPAWGTVVVNVNLDQIGRNEENDGSDPRLQVFPMSSAEENANVVHLLGYSLCPDVARIVMEENATIGLTVKQDYDDHPSNLLRRSDHWAFLLKGVPAVFLHTGLPPDYHLPTDTIDKINFPKLQRITILAFRTVWRLATETERPQPPRMDGRTD
jgi:hypothetical protein